MIQEDARPLLVSGVWTIPKRYPIAGAHGVFLRATLSWIWEVTDGS